MNSAVRIALALTLVFLVCAAPAAAGKPRTLSVDAKGSKGAVFVSVFGKVTESSPGGLNISASAGAGKDVFAKSHEWAWHENSNLMHTRTQVLTVGIQISHSSGLTDCAPGTYGILKLTDSTAKVKGGRTRDSIKLGHWSAPCKEFALTFANIGKATASVTIKKR